MILSVVQNSLALIDHKIICYSNCLLDVFIYFLHCRFKTSENISMES